MQSHAVKYPFVREEVQLLDEEGGAYKKISWRPGTITETDDEGYERTSIADGEGEMILMVVGTYKPLGYPERTFYIRQWRTPDGEVFGKKNLRITTTGNFKTMLRGFRYEYELAPPKS